MQEPEHGTSTTPVVVHILISQVTITTFHSKPIDNISVTNLHIINCELVFICACMHVLYLLYAVCVHVTVTRP